MVDVPARIRILAASDAPVAVVIRRKPTKVFHLMRWDSATDGIEHGSWFGGKLQFRSGDISPDGRWLFYEFRNKQGDMSGAIGEVPRFDEMVRWDADGPGSILGYWPNDRCFKVATPGKPVHPSNLPFRIRYASLLTVRLSWHPLTDGVRAMFNRRRMRRDGWQRVAPWQWKKQPSPDHPTLTIRMTTAVRGDQYHFTLNDFPDLLDDTVTDATWDSLGQLLVGREGRIERYRLDDLGRGKPSFMCNFARLQPPWEANIASP